MVCFTALKTILLRTTCSKNSILTDILIHLLEVNKSSGFLPMHKLVMRYRFVSNDFRVSILFTNSSFTMPNLGFQNYSVVF